MEAANVEVEVREHFQREDVIDLSHAKDHSMEQEDFVIAFCENAAEAEVFALQNVPVVSYEPKHGAHLSHPKTRYVVLSLEGIEEHYLKKVWCRYFGFPWTILETERTVVREICLKDIEDLFHLYEGDGITDYMEPLFDREAEIQYQKDYIDKVYGFYEYGMWVVIEKATGELIGRAGVESRNTEDVDQVELGYVIRKDKQNLGFATEVCRAIVDYAREELGMSSVRARVHPDNLSSVRIVEKLGMKPLSKKVNSDGEITFQILFFTN
jgi:RimJ/RimL family protein N-acetyltransferase